MVTVNPHNIGSVEEYEGDFDVPAVMAGNDNLVILRKQLSDVVMRIVDERFGAEFLSLLNDGTLSTPSFSLGTGTSFDVIDGNGGVPFSIDELGRLLAAGLLFGRDKDGGFSIGDMLGQNAGPVVGPDGSTRIGNMLFGRDKDGGWSISDMLGAVLMRYGASGLEVLGQRIGPRDIYLPSGPLMSNWRYARAGVLQGVRPGRLALIGDSNTGGTGSGGPGLTRRELSMPTVLAKMLNRSLGAASYSSVWGAFDGTGLTPATYSTYWPAVTAGSGWSFTPITQRALGEMWQNSTTTDPVTLNPNAGRTWDTAEIYVAIDTAVTVRISNGVESEDYTPATGQIVKIQRTFANNSNPLSISRVDGGNLRVIGWAIYNSAAAEMAVFNVSRGGFRALSWSDDANYYSAINALKALAPDAAGIQLMINDQTAVTAIATFKQQYQSIIDALTSVGTSVFLIVSMTPDRTDTIAWEAYVAAVYDLARENGLPLVDMTARAGAAAEVTNAKARTDSAHPNGYGYADAALAIDNLLINHF